MLTEDQMLRALESIDPQTKRLPPGMLLFAEAIEAEVRKEYEALIRQMLEALDVYQGFIDDAHIIEGQWHWLDDAKPAITAARARLGEKEPT